MTQDKETTRILSAENVERIYRYCYRRLHNSYDAEDLAQEIILAVLHGIQAGAQPHNKTAWLWAVVRNQWYKYLQRKQQRQEVPLLEGGQVASTLLLPGNGVDDTLIDEERKWELYLAVGRLAQTYRETVVMHYLQGLTISQIATRLSLPEGTVKRRLHDARNQIREGMVNMQESIQRSYMPPQLSLWGGYGIPKYWHDLERSLTRNILAAAYDAPVTVTQLAKELGVAATYVEEELQQLLAWRFIKEYRHNAYYTDFIILPAEAYHSFQQQAGDAWDGLGQQLVDILTSVRQQITALDFYGKDFPWSYLLWIFIVFASESYTQHALAHYKTKWKNKSLPAYTKEYRIAGTVHRDQADTIEPGMCKSVSWSNLHNHFANVCGYRSVMYANLYQAPPFSDRDHLINAANVGVILKLTDDAHTKLSEPEQEEAAVLVSKGVITNTGGALRPQLPVMTMAVWNEIRTLIDTAVQETANLSMAEGVEQLADSVLLPHVRQDLMEEYVNWIMLSCLSPLNYVLYQCREEGYLQLPTDYARSATALYLRTSQT